jgi:hypothetical protein
MASMVEADSQLRSYSCIGAHSTRCSARFYSRHSCRGHERATIIHYIHWYSTYILASLLSLPHSHHRSPAHCARMRTAAVDAKEIELRLIATSAIMQVQTVRIKRSIDMILNHLVMPRPCSIRDVLCSRLAWADARALGSPTHAHRERYVAAATSAIQA